jgi:hypothetical protein
MKSDVCEPRGSEPGWAESEMNCQIRGLNVRVKRFYHFYSRGCCATYSYLSGIFCEKEDECKKLGLYEQCPVLKEMMARNE